MTNPAAIEEIPTNVACGKCGYNLRGLRGEVVTCPECGWQANITELLTRKWTGPWWKAPGLNDLAVPTVWTVGWAAGLFAALCVAYNAQWGGWERTVPVLTSVIAVAGWIVLLTRVARWWPGRQGVTAALLAMVAFLGYVVMGISAAALLLALASARVEAFIVFIVALPTMFISAIVAYRIEQWIARECIRRYLIGPAQE